MEEGSLTLSEGEMMTRGEARVSRLLLIAAFVGASACGEDPVDPVPTPTITSVGLVVQVDTLRAYGATTQVIATVTGSDGVSVNAASLSWTTSDESVASVDADGVVTAVGNGEATITATVGSISGSATVVVEVVEEVVLSDDFSNGCGQWVATLEVITGTGSSSEACPASGGSDGSAYRSMSHVVDGGSHIAVHHVFNGDSLVAGASGSGGFCARTVRFGERRAVTGPAFPGAAVAVTFVIVQGGVRYQASRHTFSNTGWEGFDTGELTAADFTPTGLDLCPSANSTLVFGYSRENSSSGGGYTNLHGIDEWSVRISGVQY